MNTLPIPPNLQRIIDVIPHSMVVGGAVRDWLLGIEPKDYDLEVYGMPEEELENVLSTLGKTDLVGKSFGIIKTTIDGETYDISLPRRETKTGEGHKGFSTEPDPFMTPEVAASRRDLTINAMGWNVKTNTLFDPFNGQDDIRNKVLRHTSPAFSEDDLRPLRCFQFAARFGMDLHPDTAQICREMAADEAFSRLPESRIYEEFEKFLLKGKNHNAGFRALEESGWSRFFPEISALYGLQQDTIWHPEGDVITHTGHCLDALKDLAIWKEADNKIKTILATAVLCHDLGKATTTNVEWKAKENRMAVTAKGHEAAGQEPAKKLMDLIRTPANCRPAIEVLVVHHMAHVHMGNQVPTEHDVLKLAAKISPTNPHAENARIAGTIEILAAVVEADHSGRPPLAKNLPEKMRNIKELAEQLGCLHGPQRPLLSGKDLQEEHIPPGAAIGLMLKKAYEAQLAGNFKTKAEGKEWISVNKRVVLTTHKLGPTPLITGHELMEAGVPKGPELTRLTRKAYNYQLAGTVTTKENALKKLGLDSMQMGA